MLTKTIDISKSKELQKLLSDAMQGVDVILAKGNLPLVRLVPIAPTATKPRMAGLHLGAIKMSADFDEPLDDAFWLGAA